MALSLIQPQKYPEYPDQVLIDNLLITDFKKIISLTGRASNVGSSSNCTLRKVGESSGYAPPANTKFIMLAYVLTFSVGSISAPPEFGFSDNDVGFASSTSFTNYVVSKWALTVTESIADARILRRSFLCFPPEKFIAFKSNLLSGNFWVSAIGIEKGAN